MLPFINYKTKSCEGLTYNSSVDILFRPKLIISICNTLKTSGQYSVFYAKVAIIQRATLLLTVLNVNDCRRYITDKDLLR